MRANGCTYFPKDFRRAEFSVTVLDKDAGEYLPRVLSKKIMNDL